MERALFQHSAALALLSGLAAFGELRAPADTLPVESDSTTISYRTETPDTTPLPGRDTSVSLNAVSRDTLTEPVTRIGNGTDEALPDTDTAAVTFRDTSFRAWREPFWSFGIGWSPGSMPIFKLWESGLLDSGQVARDVELFSDTVPVFSLQQTEKPSPYSVGLPITLSFSPITREDGRVTIRAKFLTLHKYADLVAQSDSPGRIWTAKKSLSFTSLSVGLTYYRHAGEKYFSVDAVEDPALVLGLSAIPLASMTLRTEKVVAGSKSSRTRRYFGVGASWCAGVSTHQRLTKGRALTGIRAMEVGFEYRGMWLGRFMRSGHHAMRGDLDPSDGSAGEALSCVAHRFTLFIELLASRRKPASAQTATPPSAPPGN